MNLQKRNILVDTNVFISAFKTGRTKSTELFIELINDEKIQLICNDILLEEYKKYSERLGPKSEIFFKVLKLNCIEVNPDEKQINKCKSYFSGSYADMIHAATCLKSGSLLLTNDKHFDNIRDSKLIEVWDISRAITQFLK